MKNLLPLFVCVVCHVFGPTVKAQEKGFAISLGGNSELLLPEPMLIGGFAQVRLPVFNGHVQVRLGYDWRLAGDSYTVWIKQPDDYFVAVMGEKSEVLHGELLFCNQLPHKEIAYLSLGYYGGKAELSEQGEEPSPEMAGLELRSVYRGIRFSGGLDIPIFKVAFIGGELGLTKQYKREPASEVVQDDPMYEYYNKSALRVNFFVGIRLRVELQPGNDKQNSPASPG